MLLKSDLPKGRKSGFLTISMDRIVFSSDDYKFSLPLRGMEIKFGGAANRLLYFTNTAEPNAAICTPDKKILKEHDLNLDPDCFESIRRLKQGKRKSQAITFAVLLFLAAIISLPFIFSDAIIGFISNRIPVRVEQKFGDMAFKALTADKTILEDKLLNAQLAGISASLVNVVKQSEPDHDFEFYIINDPTLNAFALPGGKVVVHSGLLLKVERPEEIAALLAHEIAHVTCRHHIRQALKSIGIFAAISTVTGNASTLEQLGSYGGSLLALKHSRKAEFQADAAGLDYIQQANIDPTGFVDLFERFESNSETVKKLENALDILSTHPPTDQRIKKLAIEKRQLPNGQDYYKFDLNFAEFQENLRDALK